MFNLFIAIKRKAKYKIPEAVILLSYVEIR